MVDSRGMVAWRARRLVLARGGSFFGQWKPLVCLLLRGDARCTQDLSAELARSQANSGDVALR